MAVGTWQKGQGRAWALKLALAVVVAGMLPGLPRLMSQGLGPDADLSSKLHLGAGVSLASFAVLFLAGVLTSLTPCVYPLIPITLTIFGASRDASRGRRMALSATYVGGIALMYSSLGVFAALSGRAFGRFLSSPWVVGVLALFLIALAASLFGAFEIALPSRFQARLGGVRKQGFAGAFGMGCVAGITAAPCTGPILAGVLAFVATRRDAVLGFWMLFAYSLGVGLLFFVLGATSLRLPRSGPWMETVKSALGIALLAAGVALVLPLLPHPPALSWTDRRVAVISAAVAFLGIVFGALTSSFSAPRTEQFGKAAGMVLLLGAIAFRFGWLGAPRSNGGIPWRSDEAAAIREARQSGKPLLIDFSAEWCAACHELDRQTFSDPKVADEIERRFIPLRIDATDEDVANRVDAQYHLPGLPTVLMMACRSPEPAPPAAPCAIPAEGPGRVAGFVPASDMLERMRHIE